MRGKSRRTVGLSIGSRKIALAEIHVDATGVVQVDRVGVADTPDEAVYNGRIVSPAAISRAVRELFATAGIDGTKEVSLAISDESSITRLQVLPSMSRSQTLEALMGEVENYAAFSGTEPALDFQVTDNANEGAMQQMEVLFVATPRELVNSYLSSMEAANLNPSAIETRPLAVLRAFTSVVGQNEADSQNDKPMMLASIEENVGMIIIVRNKTIQFIHDIEIGSSNLQSEKNLRELARELRSSVNYYHRTFPMEGMIENVILFTDGSETVNVRERLEEFLQLEIVVPQVPAEARRTGGKALEHNLSAYAAIGAAIRMANRDEASINLLSSSRKPEMVNLRKRVSLFLMMLLSIAFLSVGARVGLKLKADSVEEDLVMLQERQEISEARASAEIPALQAGITSLRAQTRVTDAAIDSIKWANCTKILKEIRAIIPKSVWLTHFRWRENEAVLDGFALSYDSVFKFWETLVASPYFHPVKIIFIRSTEIAEQSIVRFEIRCGVRKEKMGGEVSKVETG